MGLGLFMYWLMEMKTTTYSFYDPLHCDNTGSAVPYSLKCKLWNSQLLGLTSFVSICISRLTYGLFLEFICRSFGIRRGIWPVHIRLQLSLPLKTFLVGSRWHRNPGKVWEFCWCYGENEQLNRTECIWLCSSLQAGWNRAMILGRRTKEQ